MKRNQANVAKIAHPKGKIDTQFGNTLVHVFVYVGVWVPKGFPNPDGRTKRAALTVGKKHHGCRRVSQALSTWLACAVADRFLRGGAWGK